MSHVTLSIDDFYKRIARAIRAVDPYHILWLDGNTTAMEQSFFDKILPNSVYALHDYAVCQPSLLGVLPHFSSWLHFWSMGFPWGETYTGGCDQKARLEQQLLRKTQFMIERGVPCWNGEFGPVYSQPHLDGGEHQAE